MVIPPILLLSEMAVQVQLAMAQMEIGVVVLLLFKMKPADPVALHALEPIALEVPE